ncbi:MAG: C40 family peptidase [Rhodanobacteraceae bacterium]
MATTRRAVFFCFSAAALTLACLVTPALARPLLPPELPSIETPAVAVSLTPAASDAAEIGAPVDHSSKSPRRMLADFALKLRNIAYVRGGRELTTGFDCSGFVRYVYQHALGEDLPTNSVSQFESGEHVDKNGLRMGDLVFFRTHGKRISHVGIYLDNGLFIHSPSRGKRVRIDHLDGSYWAKRFAGAKRPDSLT